MYSKETQIFQSMQNMDSLVIMINSIPLYTRFNGSGIAVALPDVGYAYDL